MAVSQLPAALVERLCTQLGPENVVVEGDQLEEISRTCIPYRQYPAAAVYPCSVEQVSELVKAAAEYNVPVWPVSTGKNWGYGEKIACYPGGITLVLERMNKIHFVDEELGYAVIEPGVTYQQLSDHLRESGSRFWSDSAGTTRFASVLGNALDKGRGLTPYADHFGCLCGMDVVLPDGSLLETGGGPQGNNEVRHTYKWGVGPYMDGLFVQSNLGVVVQAGIWLMPEPEQFDFAVFEYTAPDDKYGAFIDDMRELVFQGALRSHPHIANDFAMMCILSQYPFELLQGARSLNAEGAETWRNKQGVARWTFAAGLYGSREEVKFQKRTLKRVLGKYGILRFLGAVAKDNWYGALWRVAARWGNRLLGKSDDLYQLLDPSINLYRGVPTDYFVRQAYFKSHDEKPMEDIDPARDQCGFVWIGPTVPFSSRHVEKSLDLARALFTEYDFDFFVEVIIESARSVFLLAGVFYDRNDPDEEARALAWYEAMRETFVAHGYPPYRATTMSQAQALDTNPVARDVLAKIKESIDPANVIAPGRYGTPLRVDTSD
ncbi:FAD-binding protein [Seongchinamella sediminis]|uniref:FAD-binding protein n=1 Tax=Seongchinamella sediminis TaxID=2283635 RepID=A0A3L7DSZ6_9GAMM|nr:FAD-binding oxidoreductase [Seongchinamella sediminis]RLQ20737.1 FAD-binding protein [Seongchinamella sediminis]